jgi:ADP-ribosylglycohydrolase
MGRVLLSLDGLSVGDAFGGQFFIPGRFGEHFPPRTPPPGPWRYTDDTEMALAITEVLGRHGRIRQPDLARSFARRYDLDSCRGYGPAMHDLLPAISMGIDWREASRQLFGGEGSFGNGGAMRAAPVGAYFADDLARVVTEAAAAAEVTHAHREGQAGAVAVAVAAAWASNPTATGAQLLEIAIEHTPTGKIRDGLECARQLALDADPGYAAYQLGNGSRVTAMDTVPFCLWVCARHLTDYAAALWTTISVGGDIDTTAAIVGGVVALAAGREAIPAEWLARREELDFVGGRNPIDPRRL